MAPIAFNRIKAALAAQRSVIARSPEAAAKLISDLGIRDILIDRPGINGKRQHKAAARKIAAPKRVSTKVKSKV